MGIAVSIVSAILKSVVGDKFGSGLAKDLIGISIDGISEKSIKEITDFINREKNKIDNILSREYEILMNMPQINFEYVEAEIKDLLSKIDITDELFRQCRYDSMNLSAFLWNKYCECKEGNIEYEREIKRCLFEVAEALINLVCESENFEKDVLIHISNAADDTNVGLQKLSEYMDSNFGKLSVDNQAILEILKMILKQNQGDSAKNKEKRHPIKSRTQEYADKWNANMFLNDFDEWDEKAGVNVKLSDVYIDEHLPHFIWGENVKESDNLDALISQYIMNSNENKMLLILGQPGIGKSTLITWITVKFKEYLENILVYRFAEELKNIHWQKSNIAREILDALNFSYNDLDGKTLILDGFDEVNIGDNRREILDSLYGDLIYNKRIKNFSLIITCRENYIYRFERIKCKYITLQAWNEKQIRSFCNIFINKTKSNLSEYTIYNVIVNREILGIPLILYMVLALDIAIEKDSSIVDVYDRIFALDGGIYERCINNKRFADKHRITNIKKQIHQISREIAIWIFENNASEASILQEEYEKICLHIEQGSKLKHKTFSQDFLIGNYFRLIKHCEGIETEKIYFIHRSIYEYFVAETIYNTMENAILRLSTKSQEEIAKNIPLYIKKGVLSNTISEYLQHKIMKLYDKLDVKKRKKFYIWWESIIDNMMYRGMFYYNKNIVLEGNDYRNIISKENRCFLNLIEIMRIVNTKRKGYVMHVEDKTQLEKYIKSCSLELEVYKKNYSFLNFKNMWLQGLELSGINLRGANLRGANLKNVNLERADLREVDFSNAILTGANLRSARLEKAIFNRTYLNGTNFYAANIENTNWGNMEEIQKILLQLKSASFMHIYQDKQRIERKELFPAEN